MEIKDTANKNFRRIEIPTLEVKTHVPCNAKKLDDCEPVDTGESDGSGNIEVYASNVITSVDNLTFQFHNVSIEVQGDRMKGDQENIIAEAGYMLCRDYTTPKRFKRSK